MIKYNYNNSKEQLWLSLNTRLKGKVDPMAFQSKYDPKYCELVVKLGKDGADVINMCAECMISKQTIYVWQKKHPEFKEAFELARSLAEHWWANKSKEMTFNKQDGNEPNLLKWRMSARFKDWSEKHNIEQKIDQKVDGNLGINVSFNSVPNSDFIPED